jgi:predicted lipase
MSLPPDPVKAAYYGEFVKAVVAMYLSDPDNLQPAPKDFIPGPWKLSAWITMSDFDWQNKKLTEIPKFYGIVVRQIANPNNRIIAIRGTQGGVEWLDDANSIIQVPFQQVPGSGMVAFGFEQIYSTLQVTPVPLSTQGSAAAAAPKLSGSFAEQLAQLAAHEEAQLGTAQEAAGNSLRLPRPTVVTGHSLGSALATLFVAENSANNAFNITLISTLASPKVGNQKFVDFFNGLSAKQPFDSWRIVNTLDLVPKLPASVPPLIDFEHVDTEWSFTSATYTNIGCYHVIDTYLHGLNSSLPPDPTCVVKS